MKTPEEVKKWLKCWAITNTDECTGSCESCEYDVPMVSSVEMGAVALEYITQLEQRLAQAERERDAAVADFTQYVNYGERECNLCRHNEEVCLDCTWEWRGVKSNEDRRNQTSNK